MHTSPAVSALNENNCATHIHTQKWALKNRSRAKRKTQPQLNNKYKQIKQITLMHNTPTANAWSCRARIEWHKERREIA